MNLIVQASYLRARQRTLVRICNGTGAAGTPEWLVKILDSFNGWGIDFSPAANIHDWGYYWGWRWYHKVFADIIFFLNMVILSINACFEKPLSRMAGNIIFLPVRIARAGLYFLAVFFFGWGAFKS